MDCDPKGRKAGPELAAFLRNNGFLARAVNLGLFDKSDLADFVRANSENTLSRLEALPDMDAPVGPLHILTSDEVDKLQTPKPLPGLELFDESGIALLYGEGGSYKTFVALRWAHDVAKHGAVLYVAAEGVPAIKRRKAALDKLYGRRDGLYFLGDLNLTDAEHVQAIEDFGRQKGLKLLILDTLNRTAPGSKEDTEAYGKLVAAIGHLQKSLGCLILALHHTPRGGDNPRGGTALEYATDFSYLQKVNPRGWSGLKSVSLANIRNRTHELGPATVFVLVPIDLGDGGESTLVAMAEDEAERHTDRKRELDPAEKEILARLRNTGRPMKTPELWRGVMGKEGKLLTDKSGPKLLEKMAGDGTLRKESAGSGRAAIWDLGAKAPKP